MPKSTIKPLRFSMSAWAEQLILNSSPLMYEFDQCISRCGSAEKRSIHCEHTQRSGATVEGPPISSHPIVRISDKHILRLNVINPANSIDADRIRIT
jgi:hypothetical protein